MATGIRNVLMSIVAPFFATQGVLRTGIQVVLLKGWSEGREKVDSIFDSIGSLYVFGLPLLFVVLPFLTLLEPLLPWRLPVPLWRYHLCTSPQSAVLWSLQQWHLAFLSLG